VRFSYFYLSEAALFPTAPSYMQRDGCATVFFFRKVVGSVFMTDLRDSLEIGPDQMILQSSTKPEALYSRTSALQSLPFHSAASPNTISRVSRIRIDSISGDLCSLCEETL
jgi:hypothetical protein